MSHVPQRKTIRVPSLIQDVRPRNSVDRAIPAISSPPPNLADSPSANRMPGAPPAETVGPAKSSPQATDKLLVALRKIEQAITGLERQQTTQFAELSQSSIELGVLIATHLVGAAIEIDSDVLISRLQSLIPQIDASTSISIRLNPTDAKHVRQHLEQTESPIPPRLIPDSTLSRGNCLVETEDQDYLYEWRRHLSAIADELLKTFHQSSHEPGSETTNSAGPSTDP